MKIIIKIINWIINFFRKLFGMDKKGSKVKRGSNTLTKKNKKQLEINGVFNDTMPSYMIISDTSKEKLLYSIAVMKNILNENNKAKIEKAEKELIEIIRKNKNVTKEGLEFFSELEDSLTYDKLEFLIKDFDKEEKKAIIDKFQLIRKKDDDFRVQLESVDKIIDLIKQNEISLPEENAIDREVNNVICDKNLSDNLDEKVDSFTNKVQDIISGFDKDLLDEVIREYHKVNYITLSTVIVDRNYEKFKQLEEDFKNHRYNKYYYEREINRIKRELNKLKNLKNSKEINDHINSLKKELYTKSKDKYDLLYNNEVFTNALKECDMLLEKVNVKVVDIKKEKEEEKVEETEEKKKKQDYIKNILLRFQDMNLARALIMKAQEEDLFNAYEGDLEKTVEAIYQRYDNGLDAFFNFSKNRARTEYVILFNDLSKIISEEKKEGYYSVDHINFRVEDLKEAVGVKMDEVSSIMRKRNISYDDTPVKERLGLIPKDNKKNNSHILTKSR